MPGILRHIQGAGDDEPVSCPCASRSLHLDSSSLSCSPLYSLAGTASSTILRPPRSSLTTAWNTFTTTAYEGPNRHAQLSALGKTLVCSRVAAMAAAAKNVTPLPFVDDSSNPNRPSASDTRQHHDQHHHQHRQHHREPRAEPLPNAPRSPKTLVPTVPEAPVAPHTTVKSLGRALREYSITQTNVVALQNGALNGNNGVLLAGADGSLGLSGDTAYSSASSSAPTSPRLTPMRQNSGSSTPRVRPPATTLNIPGMTRSRASPDGKIAQRDVAAKLVIIMVGLPARGKSYITKKIQRYLSWQQHEAKIFNVGNRRRVAASAQQPHEPNGNIMLPPRAQSPVMDGPTQAAHILLNGVDVTSPGIRRDSPAEPEIDQSAKFFDPKNESAAQLRKQVAMETLDELLDFLLEQGGSVGILDATNSTIERRQTLFDRVKAREPQLGILFIESVCENQTLLEANMRLKLQGPDYKDKDPVKSLADFRERVAAYESAYVPLGAYEEDHNMQYIKLIDVGRKVIHYRLSGFLTGGIATYLSSFNLSPRQIWVTRHGKSIDNCLGKLGGDSGLVPAGEEYGRVLYEFITEKRRAWQEDQRARALTPSLPPRPGDHTPPYPELLGDLDSKNFCVWTSMLKRSIDTAKVFDEDDDYDLKNWEILNELNAGLFEGLTYEQIAKQFPEEFEKRKQDKLHYIYPGVGGEGYLSIISRLQTMVREIERITDHVLIIGHRSIARVLMAYFMDLTRDDIADLDVPLGMLYAIEPKPYGIEFHAYKYNAEAEWFDELPGYKPQKETQKGN